MIDEIFRYWLEKLVTEENPLAVYASEWMEADWIRARTLDHDFDLAMIVLNNVQMPDFWSDEDRISGVLEFVNDLAVQKQIPVIAFYGWPKDSDYPSRVLNAGASAVFRLPPGNEEVLSSLRRVLDLKLPDTD